VKWVPIDDGYLKLFCFLEFFQALSQQFGGKYASEAGACDNNALHEPSPFYASLLWVGRFFIFFYFYFLPGRRYGLCRLILADERLLARESNFCFLHFARKPNPPIFPGRLFLRRSIANAFHLTEQ
jgi:hypothetical protein